MKQHHYEVKIDWTGNDGEGTRTYRSFRRDHAISAQNKLPIFASSAPEFRGDATGYNPEELLVASLSACHMLWYLHLCAVNHVVVLDYRDSAIGTMEENSDGSGAFVEVRLNPNVTISTSAQRQDATELHQQAHRFCFIANSINFPVRINPSITASVNVPPQVRS
jgi:organic hydroperoxide reductase OsmC/OhrA